MDKNEMIRKIVEKMCADDNILKSIGELTLDAGDFEIAEEQIPDTMYVLTGRVKVKTEEGENEEYHYHPVVKDCLFNPEATANQMVASADLIELQKSKSMYEIPVPGVEYIILAVPMEVYEELQQQLDETIAEVISNVRHAAETFMRNSKYTPAGILSFESIYRTILSQLLYASKTMIGSALNGRSRIVKEINGVSYDNLELSHNENNECDRNCENCTCDYCPEDDWDEEDDDEDDDSGGTRMIIDIRSYPDE